MFSKQNITQCMTLPPLMHPSAISFSSKQCTRTKLSTLWPMVPRSTYAHMSIVGTVGQWTGVSMGILSGLTGSCEALCVLTPLYHSQLFFLEML